MTRTWILNAWQPGSAGILAGDDGAARWYSRGYLPHLDQPGLVQAVTFRLHDAVPAAVVEEWKAEVAWLANLPASDPREVELRRRIARYEDAGHGQSWLRDERIASIVERALLRFDATRYQLLAWCIMPNHVHALIETVEAWKRRLPTGERSRRRSPASLPAIVHSWKSFTATRANRILGRSGVFWFREYHDRYIRNEKHLAAAVSYIETNPVAAGLVRDPGDWRFGGAARALRDHAGKDAGAPRNGR